MRRGHLVLEPGIARLSDGEPRGPMACSGAFRSQPEQEDRTPVSTQSRHRCRGRDDFLQPSGRQPETVGDRDGRQLARRTRSRGSDHRRGRRGGQHGSRRPAWHALLSMLRSRPLAVAGARPRSEDHSEDRRRGGDLHDERRRTVRGQSTCSATSAPTTPGATTTRPPAAETMLPLRGGDRLGRADCRGARGGPQPLQLRPCPGKSSLPQRYPDQAARLFDHIRRGTIGPSTRSSTCA